MLVINNFIFSFVNSGTRFKVHVSFPAMTRENLSCLRHCIHRLSVYAPGFVMWFIKLSSPLSF